MKIQERGGIVGNKFGRFVLFVVAVLSAVLVVVLATGWRFSIERRANHNRSSNLNSDVVKLTEDQLVATDFIKKNPDLADELNDLIKLVGVVRQNYVEDKPSDEILKLAMKGIPSSLDPNNILYVGPEVEKLKKSLGQQNYFGIGVQIIEVGKFTQVTNVFPYSPAEKAGLQRGDLVLKVNGQNVWGMDKDKVVAMIKGEEGTPVTLEVKRLASQQPSRIVLVRQKVVVPKIEYSVINKNIGYLKINGCEEETVRQFFSVMYKLKNSRGLVIDLRDNPGGLVSCAQSVVGYFIGIGQPVIIEKDRNIKNLISTEVTGGPYPKNVVVLINNGSASASEIIAGDLRHYKVATLVGVRTYGKQTVQNFFDVNTGLSIPDLSSADSDLVLRLTTAHYFLPDSTNVSENGVTPDIEVEQLSDFKPFEYKTARDLQLQKAIEILTAK